MRRIMLGISQAKLGDALDLTFQQVQKYDPLHGGSLSNPLQSTTCNPAARRYRETVNIGRLAKWLKVP
jgi:hypothetical protein